MFIREYVRQSDLSRKLYCGRSQLLSESRQRGKLSTCLIYGNYFHSYVFSLGPGTNERREKNDGLVLVWCWISTCNFIYAFLSTYDVPYKQMKTSTKIRAKEGTLDVNRRDREDIHHKFIHISILCFILYAALIDCNKQTL